MSGLMLGPPRAGALHPDKRPPDATRPMNEPSVPNALT